MRKVIAGAIIDNGNILIVRSDELWTLPGGKPNTEEDEIPCLEREIQEELSGTLITDIHFYKSFTGITPRSRQEIEARVYFATLNGALQPPSAEINAVAWIKKKEVYSCTHITTQVLDALSVDGYL